MWKTLKINIKKLRNVKEKKKKQTYFLSSYGSM